jgi:hypothetical protein
MVDYLVSIHRNITSNLLEALSDTPVVTVTGRPDQLNECE